MLLLLMGGPQGAVAFTCHPANLFYASQLELQHAVNPFQQFGPAAPVLQALRFWWFFVDPTVQHTCAGTAAWLCRGLGAVGTPLTWSSTNDGGPCSMFLPCLCPSAFR